MAKLKRRVAQSGGNHTAAMASYRPAPGYSTVTGSAASPTSAGVMPQALVTVYPQPGATYSTLGYQGLSPIFTADGAAIPSTSPGRWAQLVTAGRP